MAFNVDQFRAAHRPWSFTVGGRTFTGRHVSAPTVEKYEARQRAADAMSGGPTTVLAAKYSAVEWLLRRAFPWRFSYLMRGDPVKLVMRLEPAARAEALRDFFASMEGKKSSPATLPPRTRGTPSSEPTPRRMEVA